MSQQVQEQNDQSQAEAAARAEQISTADYSAATTFEELYGDLSVTEIKYLMSQNATFKAKIAELNGQPLPQTQTLAKSQDEIDAERAAEAAQVKTPEQIQAEADRIAEEAAAANVTLTVQRDAVEVLYEGVEKLGEGSYKLTVDPEDGTPAEIFYGVTQADCFKKLRKSKASATREIRRRQKKIEITQELKDLAVETIDYAPLLQPIVLTPDEIYTLCEQQKDPITVLEATRKLRQASLTPEECARHNEGIERQRYTDGRNTAISWLQLNPSFYNCPENISAMQELMGGLNWAVTLKNMDKAYATLVEQGVLLDRPEQPSTQVQPAAQPASVVSVAAAPAVTPAQAQASAVPTNTPAATPATTGALPDARQLRPADRSSSTGMQPTRRVENAGAVVANVLTVEEYNRMPAATVKQRYQREPAFKAQVDALIDTGKI